MTDKGRTPLWGASLSWQSLNVLLQVILQLVYIRILAELLTQEDFGMPLCFACSGRCMK